MLRLFDTLFDISLFLPLLIAWLLLLSLVRLGEVVVKKIRQ